MSNNLKKLAVELSSETKWCHELTARKGFIFSSAVEMGPEVTPHGGRSEGALWNPFHKGTDPIHEGSAS